MSEFAKDSLSLEETNKLRISLGLKPLTDDGPAKPKDGHGAPQTSEGQDQIAADNYARKRDEERAKKESEEVKERIAKAQNKRDLARKLKGPTLGDSEPSSSTTTTSKDTLKWLKQSQKRAKEHAARRAKELEEQDALAAQQASYGESDLAGLRVAHELDDFAEGEERILTLRDSRILDGGDDELMDDMLAQQERDRQNIERKKGAKAYTGLDEDDIGAGLGKKKSVLAKYDADIRPDGQPQEDGEGGFRLGVVAPNKVDLVRRQQEETAERMNKKLLSLDYSKNQEVSDYLAEGEVGFKKPKTKKKKRTTRVKVELDDGEADGSAAEAAKADPSASNGDVVMAEASGPSESLRRAQRMAETENFVDDDELQASLAKARRAKAKRTFAKMTPEMIAKNLALQKAAEEAERAASGSPFPDQNGSVGAPNGDTGPGEGGAGLTFDDTTEFVRNISYRPAANESRRRPAPEVKREDSASTPVPDSKAARSTSAHETRFDLGPAMKEEPQEPGEVLGSVDAAELTGLDPRMKEEDDDEDEQMGELPEGGAEAAEEEPTAIEPLVSGGMAATLSILRNQGMLQGPSQEQLDRERRQKDQDRWMALQRAKAAAREAERVAAKAQGSAKDQATREADNRARELAEARGALDNFRDYKPDINIVYHDEFGRELKPMEAWKALSHRFHGKAPGHKKQELRLRRIEEERKREKMSAGDTPGGMNAAFQERAERMGSAHMVLSVGNKGNAPQELAMLGPNTVPKDSKGDKKGKGKAKASSGPSGSGTSSIPPPPPPLGSAPPSPPRGTSAGPGFGAGGAMSLSPSPAPTPLPSMRPAFAPVRSFSPVSVCAPGTPDPGAGPSKAGDERAKFRLELGTKRKAPDGGASGAASGSGSGSGTGHGNGEPASKRR